MKKLNVFVSIALIAVFGLLKHAMAQHKPMPTDTEVKAWQIIAVADKVLNLERITVEECELAEIGLRQVRLNLNGATLHERTSTSKILSAVGQREWINVSTSIATNENTDRTKVGWLTTAESLIRIGKVRARWQRFSALVMKYDRIGNLEAPEVSQALCDLISIRDFLINLQNGNQSVNLTTAYGVSKILTGDDRLLRTDIPARANLESSLQRVNEVYEKRSNKAGRRSEGLAGSKS